MVIRASILPILLVVILAGCGSPPASTSKTKTVAADDPAAELATVQAALRKPGASANDYRIALDQLSVVLAKMPDRQVKPLPPDQLEKLKKDWNLTDAEAVEVNRTDFGPLDAHYLHECVTFRDIARTLDVADARGTVRVEAALQWVIRHIALENRSGPVIAPALVVSRGRGTYLERCYVFAALVRQLALDVGFGGNAETATNPEHIQTTTINYIQFPISVDARVGLTLSPFRRQSPATHANDESLGLQFTPPEGLEGWRKLGYDLTPSDSKKRESILPSIPMSALSPRMKSLESLVSSTNLAFKFQLPENNVPWDATTPGTPLRVLAEMLPPEEGGTDRAPPGERRMDRFRAELVPWASMPPQLLQVPGPLGLRLQQVFGETSTLTFQPGLAQTLKEKQQRDELVQAIAREVGDAKARDEVRKTGVLGFRPRVQDDAGPSIRQLLLRGQYDEATTALVLLGDAMRMARERPEGPGAAAAAIEWAAKVPPVYAEFLRARNSKDPQAMLKAEAALNEVGNQGQAALKYTLWLASGHALADINYLIALCKLDQAEAYWRRDQAGATTKSAARTSAKAWQLFLANHPDSPASGQALRLLARSHELAGERAEASEAFKKAAVKLTGIEKAACLILAEQAKAQ